jgi:hypothetical protein
MLPFPVWSGVYARCMGGGEAMATVMMRVVAVVVVAAVAWRASAARSRVCDGQSMGTRSSLAGGRGREDGGCRWWLHFNVECCGVVN